MNNTQYHLLKTIDIHRNLSKNLERWDNGKLQYIDSSMELMKLFSLIGKYALDNKDFKAFKKFAPTNSIKTDNKNVLVKQFLQIDSELSNETAERIYDLFDFYIATMAEISLKLKQGFEEWKINNKLSVTFNMTFEYKLDTLFYVLLYPTFPDELLIQIKKHMKISNLEDRILQKCENRLVTDYKICNYKDFDPVKSNKLLDKIKNIIDLPPETQYSLDTQYGIMVLLALFNDMRKK